mmetsp:Transcript_3130/g.9549  ORF Transcript_3130/g.9549 Transcript_3130/m.9549 type:complete len:83 (-) Transcript_3130:422-670(-)
MPRHDGVPTVEKKECEDDRDPGNDGYEREEEAADQEDFGPNLGKDSFIAVLVYPIRDGLARFSRDEDGWNVDTEIAFVVHRY